MTAVGRIRGHPATLDQGGTVLGHAMEKDKLRVQLRPVSSLRPSPRNPRTHDKAQLGKIADSIKQFGWTNPILIDETGEILAGEARWRVAKKLSLQDVPCIELVGLSSAQRDAYRIADNRIPLDAGWNEDLLANVVRGLDDLSFDLPVIGFGPLELDKLVASLIPETASERDDKADDIPAKQRDVMVRRGDVWQLGRHRLMCGDSTCATDVRSLMMGEQAGLLFTSPPYGNQRQYTTGGISDWDALMQGVFAAMPMSDEAQVLVNLGLIHRDHEWQPYWADWIEWMRHREWKRFGLYVWDQGPGLPGDWVGRLAPSFELIFHFCKTPKKPNKNVPCVNAGKETHSKGLRRPDGSSSGWSHGTRDTQSHRIPDSVVRIMRAKANGIEREHPAVFPVALPQFIIEAYSARGGIVYEPFSGAGSTIIAGEKAGRRIRAMELAPEYVDVALRRWNNLYPASPATRLLKSEDVGQ